jgi:ribosomal protein S21
MKLNPGVPCRVAFKAIVQMTGIVRQAESHRHFPGKDYEIKQKEEHYYEDLCR